MRAEQSLAVKSVAENKGRPMGKPPFGRIYDKVKNQWTLDERRYRWIGIKLGEFEGYC